MYISTYISSATFAWSSKLTVDIDSMGPGLQHLRGQFSNFLLRKVSLEFKLHGMSIFHDIQMATYFGTGWWYSHMVGYFGSPTYTAYVDMTLTRSKVKAKVTGLLNFRQLAKPCMLAAMTAAPLRVFLVIYLYYRLHYTPHTHTTILRPFFRDHPSEPVPEENFWTLRCKGRLTEADTQTIWLGATPSRLTSAHLHHPPILFTGRMPFLPPNQQCQNTEGNYRLH